MVLLAALVCTGAALAQSSYWQGQPYTGDEPLPVAAENGGPEVPLANWQLRIVGSAFSPRVNNVTNTTSPSGGCVYVTSGSASTVWNTPLHLPEGSQVQTLRVYVNDTSASNLSAWFTIYDLFGNVVTEFGGNSGGISGQDWFDITGINHTINYSLYSYLVNFRPVGSGSTLQFCGVRLFFVAPTEIFIDGFETGDTSRWTSVNP